MTIFVYPLVIILISNNCAFLNDKNKSTTKITVVLSLNVSAVAIVTDVGKRFLDL